MNTKNSKAVPVTAIADTTETAGDKVRRIADQLKQETQLQIKATSRILGAAAQIAHNHDRLIHEVTDMVETDLQHAEGAALPHVYTIAQLKQQYKTLSQAKAHFGIKASSWDALMKKLNNETPPPTAIASPPSDITTRLDRIEHELSHLRSDIQQILELLQAHQAE